MNDYNTIRKANALAKMSVLVFLGIAIQTMVILPSIWQFINQNHADFFPIVFYPIYLGISFFYCLFASFYITPKMVISPFYTQLGTIALLVIIIIINYANSTKDSSIFVPLIFVLFVQFFLFALLGLFEAIFLRKVIGIYAEADDIWTETYKIETNYDLMKKLFQSITFEDYIFTENEEKKEIVLIRKNSGEIKILILFVPNLKNPDYSIMAISACEHKFEAIWKTEKAKDRLNRVKYFIDGTLNDKYSIRLRLDETEKITAKNCELKLLESLESKLSKITKSPRRNMYSIGGLIGIGVSGTILKFMTLPSQTTPMVDWNNLIGIWAGVITTMI